MQINKDIKLTPVFFANQKAYKDKFRIISNQGSSRSSKTYSIIQLLITIAQAEGKTISVVSHSLPHLKKGARRDFISIMNDWDLFDDNNFNRTDNIYTFGKKAYIEFFSADNSEKVRGPGRNILYINEANLLDFETFTQLALRTTETIFLDYNPADEYNYVYDLLQRDNVKFIKSTYRNNLANLTPEQVKEIENLQNVDQNLWRVFGLGERGTSEATIYTHWKTFDTITTDEVIYGLDFGFNNKTALVKIGIKDEGNYIEEVIYESFLTTPELIRLLKDKIPNRTKEIFADAAEPDKIKEISQAGFNIKAADKNVKDGVLAVKSKPLYISKTSTNILKEIKSYKWKQDSNARILDEPVKINDHSMDAMRYAIYTYQKKPKGRFRASN